MSALLEIAGERERQILREGFTPQHDDDHKCGELAAAAACYSAGARNLRSSADGLDHYIWPWYAAWWKPTTRRRDLIKAAALIVAEIERLDRAEAKSKEETP